MSVKVDLGLVPRRILAKRGIQETQTQILTSLTMIYLISLLEDKSTLLVVLWFRDDFKPGQE